MTECAFKEEIMQQMIHAEYDNDKPFSSFKGGGPLSSLLYVESKIQSFQLN